MTRRLLPHILSLLMGGCALDGITATYSNGDSTYSLTLHTRSSGKQVVKVQK